MSDIVQNRQASHNYVLEDKFEAGIALTGTEIKSIRDGAVQLRDAYGIISGGELFLLNCYIAQYPCAAMRNHEPTRTRKLLMHRKEINRLADAVKIKGYSLVATRMYFVRGKVKVEICLAKGKKNYDKRQSEKEKYAEKEVQQELKNRR